MTWPSRCSRRCTPVLKESFHPDLQRSRADYADLSSDGIPAPTGRRLLYRPQADTLFAVVRHGTDTHGTGAAVTRSELAVLLLAAALVGLGSAVFHPESSRVARIASGGQHGLAQSLFQVGGNAGSSLGPLLAAFVVVPRGQSSVALFSLPTLLGIALLAKIGGWYKRAIAARAKVAASNKNRSPLSTTKDCVVHRYLLALIFSKYFYLASLTNYYTFYLIQRFHLSVQSAQIHLFAFLGAVAAGTIIGGPLGDRIGRKAVIWGSILGVLPFTLLLPHVKPVLDRRAHRGDRSDFWASAFSAILVYAQELLPGKVE